MTKLIKNNQKGFTLIELMIVVAIIGILAAIAIPNFLNYQLKSKTAEAKTNIGAIRTSQDSFKAENGAYHTCTASPAAGGTNTKTTWLAAGVAGTSSFDDIGFEPSGSVYYQYEVAVDAVNGVDMVIGAIADLDGNGTAGEFGLATDDTVIAATTNMASAGCTKSGELEDLVSGEF